MSHKADLFRFAHRIAKAAHVKGECYAVTFGAALKLAIEAINGIKERPDGTLTPIKAAVIHGLLDADSLSLSGWTKTDGYTAQEGFSCFKVGRMADYVKSLLCDVDAFNLTLTVQGAGYKASYRIVK